MRTKTFVMGLALVVLLGALFSATHVTASNRDLGLEGQVRTVDGSKSVPNKLNYQGHLTHASDSSAVTDTLEMTFRFFDAKTAGAELWSEIHADVPVIDGLFSVVLGENTSLPTGLFDGSALWLQTEVGAEVLSPRKPLVSVAYGIRSQEADHAATADYAVEADHAVHADTAMFTQPDVDWEVSGDDVYHMDGNVGIGTTDPGQSLNTKFDVFGRVSMRNEAGEYALIADYSDAPPAYQRLYSAKTGGGTARDFILGVYPSGHMDQLVLKNDGNVGIGTTNPANKLHVEGTAQMTGFKMSTSATPGHVLTADATGVGTWQAPVALPDGDWSIAGNDMYSVVPGNIGIGTNAPEGLLHIYGGSAGTVTSNSAAKLVIEGNNTSTINFLTPNTYPQGIQFGDSDDEAIGWIFYDHNGDNMRFATDNSDKLTVLSNGNVGVGISNPATKLDVNGVIQATGGHSSNWNTAFGWGDHSAMGYLDMEATNNSSAETFWNSTSPANVLDIDSNTPLAAVYIDNNYAGNTWGLSSGLTSSSAGASSYGVYGFNNGSGYAVYGRNYHASGIGVRGINNSNSNFGDLGTSLYGAYGEHNSGNNGLLGSSSSGVYGSHVDGNYGYVATSSNCFYGNLVTTDPGDYAIYGYGTDASGEDGTGYSYATTLGAVKGYNYYGNPYTFAVGGFSYLDFNRSGGCLGGKHTGAVWGSLGYQNSAGTEYGGYFTSYTSGVGKDDTAIGVGLGSWGDLFGADIHGQVYGTYTEGGNYGLYSHGAIFRDDLDVHLQHAENSSTTVLYTNVSTDVTVQTSGFGTLSQGSCEIEFGDNFTNAVSSAEPIIVTVTPHGNTNGVYISDVKTSGFTVVENNQGKSTVDFSFIAIGRRAGYENPQLPEEVISADYINKLSRGLNADVNINVNGEGLYYENGQLYVGAHPSTLPDPYKPPEQLDAVEEMKSRPAEIITDTQDAAANGQAPSDRAPRSKEAR
ncbi:MAG: hypothetical protein AMJ92_11145 [candidate division Zixibacteria bacterium SM23_81]|nr:MAG: hypothetical protein AMJ92_11145 [candidate division Zixibacteria bacterium SM23_81]